MIKQYPNYKERGKLTRVIRASIVKWPGVGKTSERMEYWREKYFKHVKW